MALSLRRLVLVYHVLWLLTSTWTSSVNAADSRVDNERLHRYGSIDSGTLSTRGPSPLLQYLRVLDAKNRLLKPNPYSPSAITVVDMPFGEKRGMIGCFNQYKGMVLSVVTAKGAALIMIPYTRLEKSNYMGDLMASKYKFNLYDQILGTDGVLRKLVWKWKKDNKANAAEHWFPDVMQIVTSTRYVQEPKDGPASRAAVLKLEGDIKDFFQEDLNEFPIPNLIGVNETRASQTLFSRMSSSITKLTEATRPMADNGFVIIWEPKGDGSSGEYQLWIGSHSKKKPYKLETLYRLDWGNFESTVSMPMTYQNWGYYPARVIPLSYPDGTNGQDLDGTRRQVITQRAYYDSQGPGGGCIFRP